MAERADAYTVRGPLFELTRARIHELTREPEAVFWVFVFPIVLAAILGLAFRSKPPEALPVAVVAGPHAAARLAALAGPDLKPTILSESEAPLALSRGRVVLVVSGGDNPSYAYDPTQRKAAPQTRGRRRAAAGRRPGRRLHRGERRGGRSRLRYIDFLVPGLLGMNRWARACGASRFRWSWRATATC